MEKVVYNWTTGFYTFMMAKFKLMKSKLAVLLSFSDKSVIILQSVDEGFYNEHELKKHNQLESAYFVFIK